jgi:hypothetical protein
MHLRAVCLIVIVAVSRIAAQQRSEPLKMPYGEANPLLSPDGVYALFGSDAALYQLWIEDRRTHERRMVLRATLQTLTLAWSPDSTAFVANDRATSDVEIAWLCEARTPDRLDLRSLIVAADPGAAQFIVPGQIALGQIALGQIALEQINGAPPEDPKVKVPTTSHVHAIRWLDARHVEVQLVGHTGGVRIGNSVEPGDCFDLRYRVGRDGTVEKESQRVSAITSGGCSGMEEE